MPQPILEVSHIAKAFGDFQAVKDVSFTVGVQNLFDDRHPEFGPALYSPATEMPRTIYAQASVQF